MTRLRYLEDMERIELETKVTAVERQDGRTVISLEETIFYPQGGGQPFDQGMIVSPRGRFRVEEVRFAEGVVRHTGMFMEGSIGAGDRVTCLVDAARRMEHSRIHSAGHVVDMAVNALNLAWTPGKGYHFPDGPYVEYAGSLETDADQLRSAMMARCNELLHRGIQTRVQFVSADEMRRICKFVPDNLPANKPARIVFYGDFGVPCGGTHVARLSDIGSMTIRKLKKTRDGIRVSYEVQARS